MENKPKKPPLPRIKTEQNKKGSGAKGTKRFSYDEDYPLSRSKQQNLVTCPGVPMLMGRAPPPPPGPKPDLEANMPTWERKAEDFVHYFSLLLLPFGKTMDPRDPDHPDLCILPYHEESYDNFTKIVASWRKPLG